MAPSAIALVVTEELITAANDDCSDDWIGYTGYETIDYSES